MFWNKKEKQKEERNVLIIRYIELFLICFATIGVMLGIRTVYRNDQAYQKTIPVLRGTLSEIKKDEVETFVYENEDALLYFCKTSEETCRSLEKEMKPYLIEKGLEQKITYLNLTDVRDVESYLTELGTKYQAPDKIGKQPNLILFHAGKIIAQAGKENKELTLDMIKQFLETNQIKGTK